MCDLSRRLLKVARGRHSDHRHPVSSRRTIESRRKRVAKLARKLFSSDAAVAQWLSTPAPALGGRRPEELLKTEAGAAEVEGVLEGISHGNVL